MRIRTGHGPDDWTVSVPANPGSMPIRGSLVVAESGMTKQARHRDRKRTVKAIKARLEEQKPAPRGTAYATDEERLEARRTAFRESKRRARARAKAAA